MKKIWLWVFMIMFLLPEIFWSPIINFIYSFVKPTINGSIQVFNHNFLLNTEDNNLYLFILLIQIIGIFGTLVQVRKLNLNMVLKLLIYIILGIILILTIFIFYILFSTRHGIGF